MNGFKKIWLFIQTPGTLLAIQGSEAKRRHEMIKKIIAGTVIVVNLSFCQGYRNPPAGTQAMMNAGSFAAQADDASSCVLNPAGLVLIKQNQFHSGILGIFSETKYSGSLSSAKKENDFALLGHMYFAVAPEKSPMSFGFGITSPYGQKTEWNKAFTESAWAYSVPYSGEMKFITFTAAMGLPITEHLSIGSGIDINTSSVKTMQSVPWSYITGTPDGIAILKGDDTGTSFRIGIHYHNNPHSFGLVWSSPFEMNYSGSFSMTNFPDRSLLPGPFSGIEKSVKSNFSIKFPEIYSLGYQWNGEKIAIRLGTEFVKYSCLKHIVVDAGPDSILIPEIVKNWNDVSTYSASIEYRISRICSINAGIGFVESPVPDSTFEPTLPDANRYIYTFGTTFNTKKGRFSVFYIYNQFEKRNIQQGRFTDGIYKSSGSFVGCGYTAGI